MTTMMLDRMNMYNEVPAMQLDETFADSFMDAVTKFACTDNDVFSQTCISQPEDVKPMPLLPKDNQCINLSDSLPFTKTKQDSADALSLAVSASKTADVPSEAQQELCTLDELQSKWFAQNIVPRQKSEISSMAKTMSPGLPPNKQSTRQSHWHALHIALRTAGPRAKVSLVRTVAHSTPRALRVRDAKGRTPLMVAMVSRAPRDVVLALLEGFPQAASVPDRRQNLPIHVAIQKCYDIELVRALVLSNPQGATHGQDFHGRSALDVALQVTSSSRAENEEVVDYLQGLAFDKIERETLDV